MNQLVENVETTKARLVKVRENLQREVHEGRELKRKHSDLLSEKEKMVEDLRRLDEEKEALVVQVQILEGEKNDIEAETTQLKSNQLVADQQVQELKVKVEELEKEIGALTERLETTHNRKPDMSLLCDEACKVLEQMYHSQMGLTKKVFKMKRMMVRMDEISIQSEAVRQRQFEVAEKVKRKMVWRETNSEYPEQLLP